MLFEGITTNSKSVQFYKGTEENLKKFLDNDKLYKSKQRVKDIYLVDGYKLFFVLVSEDTLQDELADDDNISQRSIVDNLFNINNNSEVFQHEPNIFLKE